MQGFGNVGYWASKFFSKEEALIVGIVERDSAIYNPEGFDVDDVKNHFKREGTLLNYERTTEDA